MENNYLIIGAGAAGKSLAKDLKKNNVNLIGFLDDYSNKKDVLGKLNEVNTVIKKYKVTDIVFSIPSASATLLRDFLNLIESEDVKISILPRTIDIIKKTSVNINDLTDIDILSLVGRAPVKQDYKKSRDYLKNKRILITGAAGSIGSKLVKIVAELSPASLICVDWWENGMFFLQQELKQNKYENLKFYIADIKNEQRMRSIIKENQPDIIFHAAAYKHVPLMQFNPIEAFNNNVFGSYNLMRLAIENKVSNFVVVSTDKAVNPVNVMGTTKRISEMLMEYLSQTQNTTKFTAVRFGNVIQSNGSVMQIFKKQIEQNLPLTVTHEDVTRYFMTIEEAALLIIQSSMLGNSGEIFVLDMGEPIKIIDLAKSLVKLIDKKIEIKIIGLRPGEKMFEELSYDKNKVKSTENYKIFIVKHEKDYDKINFAKQIERLLKESLKYSLTDEKMIEELKGLGFNIKK